MTIDKILQDLKKPKKADFKVGTKGDIEPSKLWLDWNPRIDYSYVEEIRVSIRQVGQKERIEIYPDGSIRDGHQRVIASILEGLKTIKYEVVPTEEIAEAIESKLVLSMQKNLNPIEEAEAFHKYLEETDHTAKHLALVVGKREGYVERRLELLKLGDEARKSLMNGKITLGHGIILSRYDKKEQKAIVKDTLKQEFTVKELADDLEHDRKIHPLSDAVFDKRGCENCEFNGGHQTILTEIGTELLDMCMNAKCYIKKSGEYVKAKTKEYKEQGINVLTSAEVDKIEDASSFQEWNMPEDIEKRLKENPEIYARVFDTGFNGKVVERIYALKKVREPSQTKDEDREPKKKGDVSEARLNNRVRSFKRELNVQGSLDRIKEGSTQSKQAILYSLLNSTHEHDKNRMFHRDMEVIFKELKISCREWMPREILMSKIIGMAPKKLDEYIHRVSALWLYTMFEKDIDNTAEQNKVDIVKDFEMTEDYLGYHSKVQLVELGNELKILVDEKAKKKDMVSLIQSKWKKGQVPQRLIKAKASDTYNYKVCFLKVDEKDE